jgi:hypothetical protein
MECEVLVEQILEVEKERSIVKTFFLMEGVRNSGISIAILALFLLSSKSHKMNIPFVTTKNST